MPKPVFASGTCKLGETAESIAPFYNAVYKIWTADERGEKLRGPIASLCTDADATMRRAGDDIFACTLLKKDSPLGKLLCPLVLFDRFVGPRDIVDNSDGKHN
jgi:hypothetical protein